MKLVTAVRLPSLWLGKFFYLLVLSCSNVTNMAKLDEHENTDSTIPISETKAFDLFENLAAGMSKEELTRLGVNLEARGQMEGGEVIASYGHPALMEGGPSRFPYITIHFDKSGKLAHASFTPELNSERVSQSIGQSIVNVSLEQPLEK